LLVVAFLALAQLLLTMLPRSSLPAALYLLAFLVLV